MYPSRDCPCPGCVIRGGLSFQSRETVEEEASPGPCRGDLGARGWGEQSATQTSLISWGWRRSPAVVVARSQPQTCLDPSPADTHLHSGNGEGRPGPSLRQLQEPSSVYQPGGTGLALPHSDLSPLARKTVSPVVGRTENVSKGAVTVGSLKTSGIGLGSSMRCLLMKVLCCILLEMENLAS